MPKVDSYPHGAFSWADLATTDPEGAKRFYSGLLGWESVDVPVMQDMVYTLHQLNGHNVAASFKAPPQMENVAPCWNVYVTVNDVDSAVKSVEQAGGKVLQPPVDVMDTGRRAIISDQQGAVISLWQPRSNIGADIMGESGAIAWFELATNDLDSASEFYKNVFGYNVREIEEENRYVDYRVLFVGEMPVGVMIKIREDWGNVPPHWSIYLTVDDIESSRAKIVELGGKNLIDVLSIAMGKISLAMDPQGAGFYIFQPNRSS